MNQGNAFKPKANYAAKSTQGFKGGVAKGGKFKTITGMFPTKSNAENFSVKVDEKIIEALSNVAVGGRLLISHATNKDSGERALTKDGQPYIKLSYVAADEAK